MMRIISLILGTSRDILTGSIRYLDVVWLKIDTWATWFFWFVIVKIAVAITLATTSAYNRSWIAWVAVLSIVGMVIIPLLGRRMTGALVAIPVLQGLNEAIAPENEELQQEIDAVAEKTERFARRVVRILAAVLLLESYLAVIPVAFNRQLFALVMLGVVLIAAGIIARGGTGWLALLFGSALLVVGTAWYIQQPDPDGPLGFIREATHQDEPGVSSIEKETRIPPCNPSANEYVTTASDWVDRTEMVLSRDGCWSGIYAFPTAPVGMEFGFFVEGFPIAFPRGGGSDGLCLFSGETAPPDWDRSDPDYWAMDYYGDRHHGGLGIAKWNIRDYNHGIEFRFEGDACIILTMTEYRPIGSSS